MNAEYALVHTRRLRLTAVTGADLDPMFVLHSDPDVWRHLSSGRHLDREQTTTLIADMQRSWADTGLGYWTARAAQHEPSQASARNRDSLWVSEVVHAVWASSGTSTTG